MSNMFGWLSPTGRFIPCRPWMHMEVAEEDEEIRKIPEIANFFEKLEVIARNANEMIDREEPPEWHIYEMTKDGMRENLQRELLKHKYVRVGEHQDTLHFEAFPNVIKSRIQELKDFAESRGKNYKFEPQR